MNKRMDGRMNKWMEITESIDVKRWVIGELMGAHRWMDEISE